MTAHTDWNGDRCRVKLADALTIYNATAMKQVLLDPLGQASELELDLSQVEEMDSAGLQLLVLLKREAGAAGKRVNLSGHSAAVIRVFDLYNMAAYFGDPLVISAE